MDAAAQSLIVFEPREVSAAEFVKFWAGRYHSAIENLYTANISSPLNEAAVRELFIWKNGGPLSKLKSQSVEKNFISRCGEVRSLSADVTAESFLKQFTKGGAIWRIFWLHCCFPQRFPIYDQHVHRAMAFVQEKQIEELGDFTEDEKIELYLRRYLGFHRQFDALDLRDVDRALWVFGKFVKSWHSQGSLS